jgi:hypothetical protein
MEEDVILGELIKLCKKHKIHLDGKLRIVPYGNDRFFEDMTTAFITEEIDCGNGAFDRSGPFIIIHPVEKPNDAIAVKKNIEVTLFDRDMLFREGHIKSPVTRKTYANRSEWNEHLKRSGCTEVGNEYNRKTEEPRASLGRYDCRPNLERAVHQVFEKHGIKG